MKDIITQIEQIIKLDPKLLPIIQTINDQLFIINYIYKKEVIEINGISFVIQPFDYIIITRILPDDWQNEDFQKMEQFLYKHRINIQEIRQILTSILIKII